MVSLQLSEYPGRNADIRLEIWKNKNKPIFLHSLIKKPGSSQSLFSSEAVAAVSEVSFIEQLFRCVSLPLTIPEHQSGEEAVAPITYLKIGHTSHP